MTTIADTHNTHRCLFSYSTESRAGNITVLSNINYSTINEKKENVYKMIIQFWWCWNDVFRHNSGEIDFPEEICRYKFQT